MKTQKECWEALVNGETLIDKEGHITYFKENGRRYGSYEFINPEDWSIKDEFADKMYCRFKRPSTDRNVIEPTLNYYKVGSKTYMNLINHGWTEMEHKTFEEIQ
jgi:hypothetical protein